MSGKPVPGPTPWGEVPGRASDPPRPAGTYYDRTPVRRLDGSRHFTSREDIQAEDEVAALVTAACRHTLHRFGTLCAIDWWAERDGRLSGLVELKTRAYASDRWPCAWLNLRKWLALQLASRGTGVPALYVVKFTDRIGWVTLDEIDARQIKVGGLRQIVKSPNDIEPVIYVPIVQLKPLALLTTQWWE